MYNVLNQDGEKIQVEKINPQIHKHISGREFTEDDNFDFVEAEAEVADEVDEVDEVEVAEVEKEVVEKKVTPKRKKK